MMPIKLCWQILHVSSTTLHPGWHLSDSSAAHASAMLQCAASSPWTHTWRADGKMKTGGKLLSSFPPSATLGLMSPCPASACSLPRAVTLLSLFLFLSCPTANAPLILYQSLPLLFILSQTPGVIASSFPTFCFLTLDTSYQCFSHLRPFFSPAISCFAAGKDTLG